MKNTVRGSKWLVFLLWISCTSSASKSEKAGPLAQQEAGEHFLGEAKKGEVLVQLFQKPISEMVEQEVAHWAEEKQDSVAKELKKQYKGQVYMVLYISYEGKSLDWQDGKQIKAGRITYDMEPYFELQNRKASQIPLAHWHYISAPGLSPFSQYFLTYSNQGFQLGPLEFTLKEFGLGCGDMTISITKDLNQDIL